MEEPVDKAETGDATSVGELMQLDCLFRTNQLSGARLDAVEAVGRGVVTKGAFGQGT